MAVQNPNAVALKTVLVGNVQLPAPADRIGSGFVAAGGHYPTTFLSRGQFPLPRLPEPDTRSRRAVVAMAMPPAAVPAGPAGSVSGATACRGPLARTATTPSWPGSTSRASRPWSLGLSNSVGRDCQSPDRHDDRTDHSGPKARKRTATRPPAAGK